MSNAKSEPKVVHSTFVVERSFHQPPAVVFDALSDPAKVRLWYTGEKENIVEFTLDFREGGIERIIYKMGSDTPFPGTSLENEGRYQEIIPNERIITASTMKLGGQRISASQITFELLPTAKGTDLICTHQGAFFPNSGGPEIRKAGWNTLLDKLGKVLSTQGVSV